VPETPGTCRLQGGILINRMNRTQAAIWHLWDAAPDLPAESGYTDVSDATICLALFGPNALAVVEKLCALDFLDPAKQAPFLLQGPFSHVPCQLVLMERGQGFDGGLLFTCSRGYAHSMVHAILGAGAEFGLKPAGEQRFTDWVEKPAAAKGKSSAKDRSRRLKAEG
jgi:glycine cleavage system aminomethyltransferase T